MPRRSVLTEAEVQELLAFPESPEEIVQHYTLSEEDLVVIRQHRGDPQRLGVAVLLCAMRYPGISVDTGTIIPEAILKYVAGQLGIEASVWFQYAKRSATRREHLLELRKIYGFRLFGAKDYRKFLEELKNLALLTDRGIALGEKLVELLVTRKILAPAPETIRSLCSEAIIKGTREIYNLLLADCDSGHLGRLDALLTLREGTASSIFTWLTETPGKPTPRNILT